MTSIERTAYPRFKRLITAHELHLFFAPSRDEVEWAAGRTDCDEHLLAQLLALIQAVALRKQGFTIRQIQPHLLIKEGKRKGKNPSVGAISQALQAHDAEN
ncbi:hypothetical protein [Streptomyces sp. NPDC089799]|uniref:hypothetical protein n=1 Tax=Streptomyces sp. NPDC089799 TaxID=3155066 RepID=UPI003432F6F0